MRVGRRERSWCVGEMRVGEKSGKNHQLLEDATVFNCDDQKIKITRR